MKHTQREKQQAKRTLHHQLQMSQVRRGDQPRYPHLLWPLRWTIAHSKRMVPLLRRKKIWWQGILPLRTHTPLNEGREPLFRGKKNHAPQNRAKTPTENKRSKGAQKKQKGPRLGHRGQNPKQETRTTGKPGFGSPRATTPTSAKTT